MNHSPQRRVVLALAVLAAAVTTPTVTISTVTVASNETPQSDARPTPAAAVPGQPQEFAPGDPTFYDIPNPIPTGAHGDLVRWQRVEDSFDRFYRIMYLSTTVGGAPTIVTGLVSAPDESPPFGGYPLLVHGHGTVGIADVCAPSRAVEDNSVNLASDFRGIASAAGGFVVASTDYEGLGGPGRHPFLVGLSEGRSMLDAGLAARQIPGLYVGSSTGLIGFSQGGHGALWAAQLAAEWAPPLQVVGTVLVAPSSEVGEFVYAGVNEVARSPLTVSILAGLAASYPEAEAALPDVLTDSALELIGIMDENCFGEQMPTTPAPYLRADPTAVEPFASLLAANTPGFVATPAPVLIFHGDADLNVPIAHSETLLTRLCAAGQVVERRVYPGLDHNITARDGIPAGVEWLASLPRDATPTSSC